MSGENTVSSDEKALGAGPWQRKYPVELDLYEITNLRALLGAVGGLAGHSPLETAHTGDWTLQIAWKLDAIEMEVPEHFGPNATAEQMVERANAETQRLTAERDRARSIAVGLEQELARKDQALDEIRARCREVDNVREYGERGTPFMVGANQLRDRLQRILSDLAAALDAHLNKEDDSE